MATTVEHRPTSEVEPSNEPSDLVDPKRVAPAVEHRIITILAAASLIILFGPLWSSLVGHSPYQGTVLGFAFPVLLILVAVALGARTRRTLARIDILLVLAALASVSVRVVPTIRRPHYVVDESVLMYRAIQAVAHGQNPYAGNWSAEVAKAPTLLLDGTNPGRFGYPPLSALLGGAVAHVVGDQRAPIVLSTLGLLATAVLLYVLLPVSRRGLVVPAVVTLSALPFLAGVGYPTATMLPLLVLACYRPARLGAGGMLGRFGVVQAVALGLAMASQQLAWFIAPFLIVAMWRARRGELDRRPAALVTLRLIGIAAAAFVVVNLPFVVADPRLWLRGITDPLLQHAMVNGPSLANLTARVIGGGGNLAYWGAAAAVAFLTLLVAVAFWPQTLAAGLMVLPFVALWVSLRAQAIYYSSALPLVVAAVGADYPSSGFAKARPIRIGRLPRIVLPALGTVVVAALVVAALVSPAPLTVRITDVTRTADRSRIATITLTLHNTSDHAVTPHVTVDTAAKFTPFLRQLSGPRTLQPGGRATIVLGPSAARPILTAFRTVYLVSDDPQTLSSARLPRRNGRVHPAPAARSRP